MEQRTIALSESFCVEGNSRRDWNEEAELQGEQSKRSLLNEARHVGVHYTTIIQWVKAYVQRLPEALNLRKSTRRNRMNSLPLLVGKNLPYHVVDRQMLCTLGWKVAREFT